jgi:hypothetical protein
MIITLQLIKPAHLDVQPRKSNRGKEGIAVSSPTSPRLCAIYLRDVLSLTESKTVHVCRQVSTHSYDATSVGGGLPRHQFEHIEIRAAPVGPSVPLSRTGDSPII